MAKGAIKLSKVILTGVGSGTIGASESVAIAFNNDNYHPNNFTVEIDFVSTLSAQCRIALMGALGTSTAADSDVYHTIGATTVTAGDLNSLSTMFHVADKPVTHIKGLIPDMSDTISYAMRCVWSR
jgi:hypothetical protein